MVCVTHPQGPADYPPANYSTDPPISTDKASWPLLLAFGALCVALALAMAHFALRNKDTETVSNGKTTPLSPGSKHDKPGGDDPQGHASTSPGNSRIVSGSGWSMRIPRSWTPFDAPNAVDAAWQTPSIASGGGGLVTILHKSPAVASDLLNYTYAASATLSAGIGSGSIRVLRTHAYANHGEIEYLQRTDGQRVRTLAYIVEAPNGFAYLTFAAPAQAFKDDVKRIEPYLKTLKGR